jgi:hypothetical protein
MVQLDRSKRLPIVGVIGSGPEPHRERAERVGEWPALNYGRPLIAYLDRREQIKELPAEALVEPDFERVKEFVLAKIRAGS